MVSRPASAQVGKDAVVVEADAIKNRDTVYRALTTLERAGNSLSDVESLSSYVHEYSTKAAEALLVAAGTPLARTLTCLALCGRTLNAKRLRRVRGPSTPRPCACCLLLVPGDPQVTLVERPSLLLH